MKYRCYGCMNEYQNESGICPICGYAQGTRPENALHMLPGSLLANRYLIGKVLGFGGFGVTYIAWDSVLQQRVAIKEYLPSEFATRTPGKTEVSIFSGNKAQQFADGKNKFLEEAKRLAKFQNEPGIVRIFDRVEANNTAYIVMEYLDGETLAEFLNREKKVPIDQGISMLTPVIHSLEVVHKAGIIHRDISPDNIFITKDEHVKLIDFGAARYATTSYSRSLTVIIKPGYSPEEQYRNRGEQGPHTDVYALAAVLYRMITGETPPDALERRAFLEHKKKDTLVPPSKYCKISKNQENAILNAMNIYAESRTATAEVFLNDLTGADRVRRIKGKVKVLDVMKWPLWVKITVPTLGVAAITALTLLTTGVIEFDGNPLQVFTLRGNSVRVPSVVNCSIGVAQETLEENDLSPIISGREVSEIIPANMVLRQGVDAGSVVEKGTEIDLYISASPEIEMEDGLMPDLTYYTEDEAKTALESLGSEVLVEYEYSNDIAEGLVIRSSVGYGEPLPENEPVTLYVSKGPDPAANEESSDDETQNKVQLNRSSLSLFVGDSVSLAATGGDSSLSWNSSNPNVASVSNGTVTAVGKGSTTITVTSGENSATCAVTVQDYSISLSETELILFERESRTLSVSGAPSGSSVSWSSSDSGVATVNGGTVRAVGNGTTTITAQVSINGRTFSDSCAVTVNSGSITLSKLNVSLYVGGSETISATTIPYDYDVSWNSSDTTVATVSSGRITAISSGSTTVTASFSYGGKTYSQRVSVRVNEANVTLSHSTVTLSPGKSTSIIAYTTPDGQSVSWSSANPNIATVIDGTITAVNSGKTEIYASFTVQGVTFSDCCVVEVSKPQFSISSSSLELDVGEDTTLSIDGNVNFALRDIYWISSNPDVASISQYGRVEALSGGRTTITATVTYNSQQYSLTCSVSVREKEYGYSISVEYPSVPAYSWFYVNVIPTEPGWKEIHLYHIKPDGTTSNYILHTQSNTAQYYYCNEEGLFTAYAEIIYPDGTRYVGSKPSEYVSWNVTPRDRNSSKDVSNMEEPASW